MTLPTDPPESVSVSPTDGTSDRQQSDADQAVNIGRFDKLAADNGELSTSVAVSPDDQTSDRVQSDADQVITVDKLDQLIASNNALTNASLADANAVQASAHETRMLARRYTVLFIAMVLVILIGFGGIGLGLYSAAKGRDQLKSCVDPSGKCFKDAQKRTSEAVAQLNQDAVHRLAVALTCLPESASLPDPARQSALEACINRGVRN